MCWKCRWQQIEACRVVVVEFSFSVQGSIIIICILRVNVCQKNESY